MEEGQGCLWLLSPKKSYCQMSEQVNEPVLCRSCKRNDFNLIRSNAQRQTVPEMRLDSKYQGKNQGKRREEETQNGNGSLKGRQALSAFIQLLG